jgi:CelD/BcsL family acetyltransferase involved in cellulose biosynthesis
MRIEEVNNYDDFLALKDRWNDVLRRCNHSVFSTWEWLSTWWKHFGKERKLRVLVAQEKDEILGIAPLMLSEYNFRHLGKLRKVEFIGSQNSDYNDFILIKGHEEYLKHFLNRLIEFSDWGLLELNDINEESTSANVLQAMSNSHKPKLKLNVSSLCPYIGLPTSVEVFKNGLSRNMRKNLRKRMQKLQGQYKVEFKTQRDFGSTGEAMEIFFELHKRRWESKGMSGSFASNYLCDFHLDLARIFDEKNWLALYFLTVNNEPAAAVYSFDYNLKKYGYLTGFDPDFGQYGVGNILKLYVIEECIRRGFKEYDLTRGIEDYKMDWATGVRKNFVVRMANKGWREQVFQVFSWIKQLAR